MPWKECHAVDERLRFIARLLDGEKMAQLCEAPPLGGGLLGGRSRPATTGGEFSMTTAGKIE